MHAHVEFWRNLSVLRNKEAEIFIHKIPISHWLMTSSKTVNSLVCPAFRTSIFTGKNKTKQSTLQQIVKVVSSK